MNAEQFLSNPGAVDGLAEAMFNAYNNREPNPWKTWDGKDVPRWYQLNSQVQDKWRAAAEKAAELILGDA